ncbi:TetR family transcriptional regulator [Deinococcus cellulosilyticus]|uniref:TetR family transcriptional regulator n=1 Tax=Deinococcus cellulosilyticus (strain DSM 18568 / NBRC 106333 / KACC 11606 / 5516J-15) TaxID=1223518 RepID=A0A511N5N9_DEIC1|nr:TetR family transcriptional regulator [Deinococcus cellulosilyticus]GEM47746.1 TetR family transcriptional regulator [Deinococcus cellulosilyticus NBRC 106333 = KACC 11606]
MRRARSDTQKENRRLQILDSALELWHTTPYTDITMQMVAKSSDLAKGTLYLYFQSKEELFLEILKTKLQDWFTELQVAFQPPFTPQQMVQVLSDSLQNRDDMLRLLSMLSGVLEAGVTVEAGLNFKMWLNTELSKLGTLLEAALPVHNGVQVLMHLYGTIMGLYQTSNIPQALQEALQTNPELQCLLVDFHRELKVAALALVRGHLQPA